MSVIAPILDDVELAEGVVLPIDRAAGVKRIVGLSARWRSTVTQAIPGIRLK